MTRHHRPAPQLCPAARVVQLDGKPVRLACEYQRDHLGPHLIAGRRHATGGSSCSR